VARERERERVCWREEGLKALQKATHCKEDTADHSTEVSMGILLCQFPGQCDLCKHSSVQHEVSLDSWSGLRAWRRQAIDLA